MGAPSSLLSVWTREGGSGLYQHCQFPHLGINFERKAHLIEVQGSDQYVNAGLTTFPVSWNLRGRNKQGEKLG